jgi:hypothetical protein
MHLWVLAQALRWSAQRHFNEPHAARVRPERRGAPAAATERCILKERVAAGVTPSR